MHLMVQVLFWFICPLYGLSFELCSLCDCYSRYYPRPYSFDYTDVTCQGDSSKQIRLDLSAIKVPRHIGNIIISGFHYVLLNSKLEWSNNSEERPKLRRDIIISDVNHAHIEHWSNHCNYSFVNISNISFNPNLDSSLIELDAFYVKNSTMDTVYSKNLHFKGIKEKVVLRGVNLGAINKGGMIFDMPENGSAFIMVHTKMDSVMNKRALKVIASDIVIANSYFGPKTASKMKLNATEKIVIKNCEVVQGKVSDFFDLYSPVIILKENILIRNFKNESTSIYLG